jgi:hypothetical protein
MALVLTAGLILLIIAACGATISAAVLLAETIGRRSAAANLIVGAEAMLRAAAA